MKVYILDIHHKHGNDISVFSSEDKREKALYEYVAEYWGEWIKEPIDKCPESEAIEKYFNFHAEFNSQPEFADYQETEIQ